MAGHATWPRLRLACAACRAGACCARYMAAHLCCVPRRRLQLFSRMDALCTDMSRVAQNLSFGKDPDAGYTAGNVFLGIFIGFLGGIAFVKYGLPKIYGTDTAAPAGIQMSVHPAAAPPPPPPTTYKQASAYKNLGGAAPPPPPGPPFAHC